MNDLPDLAIPDGLSNKLLTIALSLLVVAVGLYFFLRWQRQSNRAACIMNQRNIQQSVRSYQGMNGEDIGAPINWSGIIGPGLFLEIRPTCPSHGTYTFSTHHPPVGTLAAECSHATELEHRPTSTAGW